MSPWVDGVETVCYLTGNPAADAQLASDPDAVLLGMVLDQQVRQTWSVEE